MSDAATLGRLLRLARDTVSNPREGASTVLSFAPPKQALWIMFALVVVCSLILGEVVALMAGLPTQAPEGDNPVANSVLVFGLIQAALMLIMVHGIYRIGKVFGGTGSFDEALLLTIWLQFIFLILQVVQIAAILVMPMLAGLITLAALALFFWLLMNFISVLHGFLSLGKVFLGIIASLFAFAFLTTLVLSMLGISLV